MTSLGWIIGAEDMTRYMRTIRAYPMLSAEEELALSRAWRDTQDIAAANRLVTSHLRLVVRIALGYRGYGLPVAELISEGNVGMMRALRRFDPDRGFRLATYSMWWIRAAIQEYILHSWSLVKIGTTAAQKKLFFNLRRLKSQLQAFDDGDLKPHEVTQVASRLAVPEHEVISMNRRLSGPDHSLNSQPNPNDEGQWQDWLVDETDSQETSFADREELSDRQSLLRDAVKTLDARERHIISARWLNEEPPTLDDLAQHYHVSRERIRQIEARALLKLRKAMNARVAARAGAAARRDDRALAA